MEDSSVAKSITSDRRIPLDMSSFSAKERQQFGQNIRLAMACIEGSVEPVNTPAMPSDKAAISQRLKVLAQDITSYHADLLELLVRFDDLEGWKSSGARHCAAWMNLEIGISLQLGWEYLRVGRKLRLLPTTTALFRAGKLSWSKIRLIVNVADPENEKTLCHATLDASVSDVKRLCDEYRWSTKEGTADSEAERALKQWMSRTLTWDEVSYGSTRIQLILPPETAQVFLSSVEQSLNQIEDPESTLAQRRADAAVLMAETSLQAAGRDIATADRYQVIVSVDATELVQSNGKNTEHTEHTENLETSKQASDIQHSQPNTPTNTPPKRPTLKGAGAIAQQTARRIACDCSITTNILTNGEPTDIGRKSRLWPNAMARAIKERDQHCQFYGCTQTQHLQIHHIVHWADGGATCVENGVCLCTRHHTQVHEGGYRIQRVENSQQRLNEQFARQQHAADATLFSVEKELRNNRASFNNIRTLSPTRYRFRIVDAQGQDIRDSLSTHSHPGLHNAQLYSQSQYPLDPGHSTRVECGEPVAQYYPQYYQCEYRNDNPFYHCGNTHANRDSKHKTS